MKKNGFILALSFPLAILIAAVSWIGLATPNFYVQETANWQAQCWGQDLVDLIVIVPTLLISVIMAYKGSKIALSVWGGVLLYLLYTFIIYCFHVHFNQLFVVYCLILGLSFYSLLYYISSVHKKPFSTPPGKKVLKVIGIYFIVISVIFYFLWLKDIVPAILNNSTPQSLIEVGLPTNAVHVIDLAFFLPGLFIMGISILRRNETGISYAPLFLTFTILMNITIATLVLVMKAKGIQAEIGVVAIMGVFTTVSMVLFALYFKQNNHLAEH